MSRNIRSPTVHSAKASTWTGIESSTVSTSQGSV
ncbi:Uncharacterised protein [Mycobacterium tuberculosis]|uniref:Uncharacterized protein n=1 Tax=Mycobacterium tuberculosis TaxID=1773 RepID=A0A655J3T0_MYCTX|nr:Uncharacterised protein [Mycobacterium tuberculosis]CFE92194.1 Uncharacterised protein [Mycobacterium tuberculosis]CNM98934.1 Uncharacterised protein [Mycobacterium tuberculosis]CNN25290.1 Uncharacterised protein [Mycobacterium tuberculosis]CNN63920.1 Uncharacterised protein [Mycobacterium tuberculosis]